MGRRGHGRVGRTTPSRTGFGQRRSRHSTAVATGSAEWERSNVVAHLDPVQGMARMATNNTTLTGELKRETVQAPVRCAIHATRSTMTRRVTPQAFVSNELVRELFPILNPLFEVGL